MQRHRLRVHVLPPLALEMISLFSISSLVDITSRVIDGDGLLDDVSLILLYCSTIGHVHSFVLADELNYDLKIKATLSGFVGGNTELTRVLLLQD